ncbi:hypothetical protein GA0115240_152327 [Streptomyces sp. DvalAA-14]|uniref:hypothetical protein n=1 Tax=unclassified Streptomyces TaxID=2593676 RepID=UPI00081BBC12|nr:MULTISPECIES: hypothetical protein [unclassified Streptomyces]MYS23384.1 hypothetical protein [Streptomyces sp. SID4948]SCE32483.1 hypothetical protein GA0115240_152327 [Streptomyces sp. DvalAA-14]
MRMRTTLAAAVGALTLLLAVPGPASAAEGEFRYLYTVPGGDLAPGALLDPPSRECLTIPEAAHAYLPPARAPRNGTDATATVFTGPHCDGDYYTLRPGGSASTRLELRSVVFS